MAFGLQLGYRALGADVTLRPTGKDDPLAVVTLDQSDTRLVAGALVALLNGRLRLGIAAELYHASTISNVVTSSLIGDDGTGSTGSTDTSKKGTGEATSQISSPLSSVIMGASLNLGVTTVALEGQYSRAPVGQTEYSIAELKQKDKEVYSTFVVRGGVRFRTPKAGDLMLGGRYDTSAVGQGSRGKDGMAGFSVIDLVQIYAGQATLKPSMSFGGGLEMPLGKPRVLARNIKRKSKIRAKNEASQPTPPLDKKPMYPIILGVGLVYQKASLGVDKDGEQPAAYSQTRLILPVSIIYYF